MTGSEGPRRDGASAAQYDRCVVSHILLPWVPDLIGSAGLRPGDRVLDLACGTGAVSKGAARAVVPGGEVAGLDLNPEMLAVARRAASDSPVEIRWCVGDAVALPFVDSCFDVVLCQQGLQFFSDRAAALREIRRALAHRGRLGVAVWSEIEKNPYVLALVRSAERRAGEEVGRQLQTSFSLSRGGALRTLLTGAGFQKVDVAPVVKTLPLPPLAGFVPGHLASTSVAGAFRAMEPPALAALIADVARELGVSADEEIHQPFEMLLAAAR